MPSSTLRRDHVVALLAAVLTSLILAAPSSADDRSDAKNMWQQLQSASYRQNWTMTAKGEFYRGQEPHGALLTTYLNAAAAQGERAKGGSMPAGAILVKENYTPDKKLVAITVMEKKPGYDGRYGDWWWAKYGPDGAVQAAGKVNSCIACHGAVRSNDYVFSFPIAPLKP